MDDARADSLPQGVDDLGFDDGFAAFDPFGWATGSTRHPRILVVDDTITNRKLIQAILRKEDFEIFEAEDGEQALEMVHKIGPDLILLDVMMPVKDGFEVCTTLKSDALTSDIPVIFLSAKAQTEDKVKGLELGAVDYITKPFNKGEILARVRMHIEMRLLNQSMQAMNRELILSAARLEEDLRAASNIQHSLIPKDDVKTKFEEIEMDWRFLPCDSIGGDVFNVQRLDHDHVGIYILDVSGHGVPSAMVTVSVSQVLHAQVGSMLKPHCEEPPHYRLAGPGEVLEQLDQEFPVERFDKFFTICYILLNLKTGVLKYARAAHPEPLILRADGTLEKLECAGTIVGLGGLVPFEEHEARLNPGDRLFLSTDGIDEHPSVGAERFGFDRYHEVLRKHGPKGLAAVSNRIMHELDIFSGGKEPDDDITFVALEYRGA